MQTCAQNVGKNDAGAFTGGANSRHARLDKTLELALAQVISSNIDRWLRVLTFIVTLKLLHSQRS